MLAGYRSFYLYSAVSIAVVALAVAAGTLLAVGLRAAGVGPPPASADVSRAVSLAIAIATIAIPVGGAHLVLILRSLRDPQERAGGVRHGYLTLWTTGALLIVLAQGSVLISMLSQPSSADPSALVSVLAVATLLGIGAHLWARTTPPQTHRRRVVGARVAMAITLLVAAGAAASAAVAAGQLFAETPIFQRGNGFNPQQFAEANLRSAGWTAVYALGLWAIAVAWQWRWRADREALLYGALFSGAGAAFVLPSLALEASGLIQRAAGDTKSVLVAGPWTFLAPGVVMVATGLCVLLAARGRTGVTVSVVDRLVAGIFSSVGLGVWIAGLAVGWGELTDHVLFRDSPGALGDLTTPLALAGLGLAVYVPAWRRFTGLTRHDPSDATRRFTIFTIVCLALVALVIAGVTAMYNLINGLLGVGGGDSWAHLATTAAGVAAIAAAVFASHLALLLRDQRRTRPEPVVEVPVDPLLALLEDVRAGRTSVADAASQLRHRVP